MGFADQVARFSAETKDQLDLVVRGSVFEVGRRVIERSPRKTGKFSSNWNYGLESPDTHTTTETASQVLHNFEEMPDRAFGFVHFVSNSISYGYFLEIGRSNQAPNGMVGLTAAEWPSIVGEQVQRVKLLGAVQAAAGEARP